MYGVETFPILCVFKFSLTELRRFILLCFFTGHPLSYVWRSMDHLDAICLALIQKSNHLYIDQRYSFQIKCDLAPISLQLRREFFQMLRLQSAGQPNNRLSPIGLSLNPQCHLMITAIATVT
jgi:hypothetical protein